MSTHSPRGGRRSPASAVGALVRCLGVAISLLAAGVATAAPKRLKIFILAGQSNLEGTVTSGIFDRIGCSQAPAPLSENPGLGRSRHFEEAPWLCGSAGAGAQHQAALRVSKDRP
jgi:hypothetical protein